LEIALLFIKKLKKEYLADSFMGQEIKIAKLEAETQILAQEVKAIKKILGSLAIAIKSGSISFNDCNIVIQDPDREGKVIIGISEEGNGQIWSTDCNGEERSIINYDYE